MTIDVNVLTNGWTIAGVIASFLVAAIALFLGINSSRQINKIRKDEKREIVLKDIINWATQVLECNRDPVTIGRGLNVESILSYEMERVAYVNVLSWRAVYIGFLADSINNRFLHDAVEDTRTLIRQHAKLLKLGLDRKVKNNAAIGTHRRRIDNKAKEVIELAVNLL